MAARFRIDWPAGVRLRCNNQTRGDVGWEAGATHTYVWGGGVPPLMVYM
jgi:hypothetical protein